MCRSSSSAVTRSRSTRGRVSTSSAPSRILRVGQVVTRLAAHIQSGDEFKDLWIEGEVVQARSSPVGHVYFTLRDNVGQLQCVLFAMKAAQVALTPRDGNKVLAHGYIELYTKDGRCQLQVDDLRPAGAGDAYLRLEALKRRLTAEGLFAAERKRPLPPAPRRIGIVTSPIGAVWHDIQQIIARRACADALGRSRARRARLERFAAAREPRVAACGRTCPRADRGAAPAPRNGPANDRSTCSRDAPCGPTPADRRRATRARPRDRASGAAATPARRVRAAPSCR